MRHGALYLLMERDPPQIFPSVAVTPAPPAEFLIAVRDSAPTEYIVAIRDSAPTEFVVAIRER